MPKNLDRIPPLEFQQIDRAPCRSQVFVTVECEGPVESGPADLVYDIGVGEPGTERHVAEIRWPVVDLAIGQIDKGERVSGRVRRAPDGVTITAWVSFHAM